MTKMKRTTITIPEDIEKAIIQLKKDKYFDKSYSELYRDVLRAGLKVINKEVI